MKKIIKKIKSTIKDMDKPLLIICLGLFLFGLLNIVTASSNEAVVRYGVSLYYYFFKQVQILLLGIILTIFLLNIKTKDYRKWAPLAFIGIIGTLLFLTFTGEFHKGNKNWIDLFGFTFQPSEFAKPIMIVCLAILFDIFYKRLRTLGIKHGNMIGVILFVGLLMPLIIFFQGDLGTTIIFMIIFATMFFASPILRIEKFKLVVLLSCVTLVAGAILLINRGYVLSEAQKARFEYFNPCSNYETGGYQVCNGFIAINEGGLFGVGIGKSKQKYSYIPEPHTDSVFAIIVEENGLIRVSIVFILYIIILKRILDLACKTNNITHRYICLGVGAYIFAHIFINLGGLFGLIPLTGVPLPFLSYGGSYALSLICALAVIQRIHIEMKNEKIKIK